MPGITALSVGNILAFTVIAVIVGTYARSQWEATPLGRALMGMLTSVGLLAFAGILRRVFHQGALADVIAMGGFVLVVVVGIAFERELLATQRQEARS